MKHVHLRRIEIVILVHQIHHLLEWLAFYRILLADVFPDILPIERHS